MNYLLDTNVISELVRPKPDSEVVGWISAAPESRLYLSVLTVGEIRRGIERLQDGTKRKVQLLQWLENELSERFAGRILSIDNEVAEMWGTLTAPKHRTLSAIDSLIAATCLAHDLILVTRNTKDFVDTGVTVINPWTIAEEAYDATKEL